MGISVSRILRHLFYPRWRLRRLFPADRCAELEEAIRLSELQHRAELQIVIEATLAPAALLAHQSPRERALELFALEGVWDTAENCGVLIYVLLAEHDIEIVADRGVSAKVSDAGWQEICHRIEQEFREGRFVSGLEQAVAQVSILLQQHYPTAPNLPNENQLPNRVKLM